MHQHMILSMILQLIGDYGPNSLNYQHKKITEVCLVGLFHLAIDLGMVVQGETEW